MFAYNGDICSQKDLEAEFTEPNQPIFSILIISSCHDLFVCIFCIKAAKLMEEDIKALFFFCLRTTYCNLAVDTQVLDAFLAPGSELWMFNDVPEVDRERKLIDGGLDFSRLDNITLVHREGNAVIRRHLESLPLESFDSVSSKIKLYPAKSSVLQI